MTDILDAPVTSAGETRVSWSTPQAKLVLRADAPRTEWLAARRLGLGGSDMSTVAGVNQYNSPYALWLDKTGRGEEKPQTQRMRMGHMLEPIVAELFTEQTGIPVRRAGLMRHRLNEWMQVSVDRLSADGGICEYKTTNWRTNDAEVWQDGEVPDHAEIQSQWGLAVTGRTHAHAMVLIDGHEVLHRVIPRDDNLIETLVEMGQRFWFEQVLADVAPEIDGSDATSTALRRRYSVTDPDSTTTATITALDIFDEWRAGKAKEQSGKSVAAAAENRLRELIGEFETLLVLGDPLVTCKQNGTFGEKRFTADHPELAEELVTTKTVLDTERLKTEHPDLYAAYRARVLRAAPKKKG